MRSLLICPTRQTSSRARKKEHTPEVNTGPVSYTISKFVDAPSDTRRAVESTDRHHPALLPAAICYPSRATMTMRRLWTRAPRSRLHRLLPEPQKPTPGINMWRNSVSQNTSVYTSRLGKRNPAVSAGISDILLQDTSRLSI